MPLPLLAVAAAGMGVGALGSMIDKAPEYQAPSTYISSDDIDRLINLSRKHGLAGLRSRLGESHKRGAEMMAGQGMAGTGGIPAQVWGQVESGAYEAEADLELGLSQQKMEMLFNMQGMENQNAWNEYQSKMAGWGKRHDTYESLMDVGGMATLTSFM